MMELQALCQKYNKMINLFSAWELVWVYRTGSPAKKTWQNDKKKKKKAAEQAFFYMMGIMMD